MHRTSTRKHNRKPLEWQPGPSVTNSGSSCTQRTTSVVPDCATDRSRFQEAVNRNGLSLARGEQGSGSRPDGPTPQVRNEQGPAEVWPTGQWAWPAGRWAWPTGRWAWLAPGYPRLWPNAASWLALSWHICSHSYWEGAARIVSKIHLKHNQVINPQ
ncbi:hypothetical protein HJG60_010388 [Phyllostomus discolor]|uniref:Uncharacterized protein n=1 Tax=Phyllostomus discolor TaxID=89673 RepID=A0A834AYD8_9CHIR|nr:hypothetical protein HJG60_010388 [Phyllostomus discolor]